MRMFLNPEDTAILGEVCRPVDAHQPAALDPLAVEPGDSTAQKADHRRLLLVRKHFDIGQTRGVINGDMDLVVAHPVGTTPLPFSGDAVAHFRYLASDLMSMWIRSPGRSHSYRCTGVLGSRFLSRATLIRLRTLATVEKGV